MKMLREICSLGVFGLCLASGLSAQASWYWPFGTDEDDTNAPPRLHRLLVKANDYIELAEDEQLNGEADKAIENYRLALAELDRIEQEHPDRAATQEFAPLRNRRAACTAALDAIRFAQVNDNERPVAVSDTTELQKKWNKKHGIPEPDESQKQAPKPVEATAQKQTPADKEKPQPDKPSPSAEDKPQPKIAAQPPPKPTPPKAAVGTDWDSRFRVAYDEVRRGDYAAADLMLEKLIAERPSNLNALLLRAAAQSGSGSNYAARRTLEKAMRAHPKSYLPYYNLAHLALVLGEGSESARQYYEMGRAVGGPSNEELRKKTGARD